MLRHRGLVALDDRSERGPAIGPDALDGAASLDVLGAHSASQRSANASQTHAGDDELADPRQEPNQADQGNPRQEASPAPALGPLEGQSVPNQLAHGHEIGRASCRERV